MKPGAEKARSLPETVVERKERQFPQDVGNGARKSWIAQHLREDDGREDALLVFEGEIDSLDVRALVSGHV